MSDETVNAISSLRLFGEKPALTTDAATEYHRGERVLHEGSRLQRVTKPYVRQLWATLRQRHYPLRSKTQLQSLTGKIGVDTPRHSPDVVTSRTGGLRGGGPSPEQVFGRRPNILIQEGTTTDEEGRPVVTSDRDEARYGAITCSWFQGMPPSAEYSALPSHDAVMGSVPLWPSLIQS